jgi:hypothetical protein
LSEVTLILYAIEQGDPHAAAQLLPRVYAELRKLAAQKLGREKAGQTLQATALVHEAYVRLVDGKHAGRYCNRNALIRWTDARSAAKLCVAASTHRSTSSRHNVQRHQEFGLQRSVFLPPPMHSRARWV